MGKDKNYQAPSLETLLSDGEKRKYPGDNTLHKEINLLVREFDVQIESSIHNLDRAYLTDLAVGFRILALFELPTTRYNGWYGSKLTAALEDELHLSKENELSNREKLIYLSKLYDYCKHHFTEHSVLPRLETALKNLLELIAKEIAEICNAVPTQKALTSVLEKLDKRYVEGVKEQNKTVNPDRLFIARFASTFVKAIEQKRAARKTDFERSRDWQAVLGLALFVMISVRDGKDPYLIPWLRSPYGRSTLYTTTADAWQDLYKADPTIQLIALATFKRYFLDNDFREAIAQIGLRDFNDDRFGMIDASLFAYEEPLQNHLKVLCNGSSYFPEWAITLAIVGALVCGPVGYGLGATMGSALNQTDNLFRFIAQASPITGKVIQTVVGEGRTMSVRATEMITGEILSCAFGDLFRLLIGGTGAAVGAATGHAWDQTKKMVETRLQKAGQLNTNVKDIEFVTALLSLPKNVLPKELKMQIENRTMGMFDKSKKAEELQIDYVNAGYNV